ncbi:hypothetical protein LCGC14_0420540 [marine sediment metagenome]|uniref:Uncharacterized protein n=1 Tax=marine sediment metagenome TaxID=412755 RepID=A0A0F9SR27_9ZZZZ
MKNIDKHYQKYEHYMRKVERWPCPHKIYFEIWERLKKDSRPSSEEIKIRIIDTIYGDMAVPDLIEWLKKELLVR